MARFHGVVGYAEAKENPSGSGIWVDEITEFPYSGNIIRNTRNLEGGDDRLNENIRVANSISILADQYAVEHFFAIKYVGWAGTLWTVTQVEVKRPRLVLTLGSVYNGPKPPPKPPDPIDPDLGD